MGRHLSRLVIFLALAPSARLLGGSGASAPTPTPTPPPISATFLCRQGAEFHVKPDTAEVAVNGKVIGIADDWDNRGGGRRYFFKHTGWYLARFRLPGYQTTWVKVIVDPTADKDVAKIKLKLPKGVS